MKRSISNQASCINAFIKLRLSLSHWGMVVFVLFVLSAAFAQTGANAKVIQRISLILRSVSSINESHVVKPGASPSLSSADLHSVEPGLVIAGVLNFGPASGRYGDTITASPSGNMTPNSTVTMRFFSGDTVGVNVPFIVPCATDSVGFFNCSFKVPALFFGSHNVTVTDSNNEQSSSSFSIQSGFTLSPAIGPAGTRVTVSGGGWARGDTIIVSFDNNNSTHIGCPAPEGAFTCQFDVPGNATTGDHTFQALGHVPTTTLSATFKVAPGASLTLAPTSEHAGANAQVSGAGLLPNTILSLEFNHAAVSFGSLCQTNSTGSFANCSYTVPSLAAGTYSVSVFDGTSNPKSDFTINPSPTITVTDPIGPNSNLNISGSNFGIGKSLTFDLDGVNIVPAGGDVFTDVNGNIPQFTSIFLVKETTLGKHTLTVNDGNSLAQADFTVVSVVTVSPQSGPVASSMTLTGYGFAPNQDVSATYAGLSLTGLCRTDAGNSFSCTYAVPVVPAGPHTLQAVAANTSATNTFTITPTVSVTNSSGLVGGANTLNGTGFAANQNISATLGAANITFNNSCNTGGDGTFSCPFAVPAAPIGQRSVQATDTLNNSAGTTFTISPSISLTNNSGAVGSTTTMNGFGFAANKLITATLSGSAVAFTGSCSSDGNGSFSCGITLPALPVGQKAVQAKDALQNSAAASFTITPSISLTKTSGTVGSANTLNGSGFAANKGVDVTLGGVPFTFTSPPCNTDGNGSFSCGFTTPSAPAGSGQQVVQATDKANNAASVNFTYIASISLTHNSGNVGSDNVLNGTAFGPNASITATLGGAAITFTSSCNTDGTGSFSCPFAVPAAVSGTKTVQASDAGGNAASTNFSLNFSISLTNTSGTVGSANTLKGSGFFANTNVTNTNLGGIAFGFLNSCLTDGNGSFSCAFNVPTTTAGLKNVSASVSGLVSGLPVIFKSDLINGFLVMPAISLTSNSGIVSSSNVLNGTGFAAAKTVTAMLDTANISMTAPCTTAGNGSFSCGFTVPSAPNGDQTLQATDAAGNSASTTFTVGVVDLTITKTHTGNFTRGDTGKSYTITVNNSGTLQTSGAVTVVDTLPAALSATAINGDGWSCDLAALTCTRNDALNIGASYPSITVTVNVANNASTTVTNTATVSTGADINFQNNSVDDVTTVNVPPVAVEDAATVNEDSSGNAINVLSNDTDSDNDLVTITSVTQGTHGSVAITGGGTGLIYTPAADYFGPDTFTYTVSDGHGGIATANVNVTVAAVNDPPSFTKGANQMVDEDAGAQTVPNWATNILAGPPNESGQTLDFIVANDNNPLFSLQPAILANGTLSYTPAADANGTTTVSVKLHDNGGGQDTSAAQTFTITVNAINDPPSFTKGADSTINESAGPQVVKNWATNISQGPNETGQTLTFNVSPVLSTGTLTFSSPPAIDPTTGTLTYTASQNSNGTATFNVTLSDDGSNTLPNRNTSAVQTFMITVNAVNDEPSFQILNNPPSINEDAGAQTVNSFATDFKPGPPAALDESGQTLVGFTITQTGTAGGLTFTSGPSISNAGVLTYTVAADKSGTATFNAVATDSGSGVAPNVNQSAPVSFTITVNAVNDAPVLDNTGDMSLTAINEDVPNAGNSGTLVSDVIASAGGDRITDADPGAIEGIAVIAADNTNGAWQFSIGGGANWTAFGTPDPLNARLLASDANTRVRFIPNPDFNGTLDPGITFRAWDQTSGSNGNTADTSIVGGTAAFSAATETASINIAEVNDAPTANNDVLSDVAEDSGARVISFAVLTGNDVKGPTNESDQTLTVNNVSNPVGGTVIINAGNVIFVPAANYNGPASFQYTVLDNGTNGGVPAPLQSPTSATVSFNITAVADTPSVTNATTNEDTQTVTGLVITRNPSDGAEVTNFKITGINGGLLFQNNGSVPINDGDFITVAQGAVGLKFTPALNSNANGSFRVQSSLNSTDAGLGGSLATATITVNPVNDAPTLDVLGDRIINKDAPLQTVSLAGISAGGGESQTLTITAVSNNPSLVPKPTINYTSPNATGSLTFAPAANQSGTALITVTVDDGGGTANGGVQSVARTFTVTVNSVNHAPVNTVPGAQNINQGTSLIFSTANSNRISIADVDAGANELQVTLTATNATLTLNGTSGLTFSPASTSNDGVDDATLNFTGTTASINTALNGLIFKPAASFSGPATLQIATNDQGNTGKGGALSDVDTIAVTVKAVPGGIMQFNSASYATSESAGAVTITVQRLGDLSQLATVDYATPDDSSATPAILPCSTPGFISSRCDFTAAIGTLKFAPGENAKTFDVLISQDNFVEGPESLTLTLSNPTNSAVLGSPSTATLMIADDVVEPAGNPIDDSTAFVRQQYHDFLNREPDAAGLAFWVDNIDKCNDQARRPAGLSVAQCIEMQRTNTSAAFFLSIEFQQSGYYVYRTYKSAFGDINPPTSPVRSLDFMRDTQEVQSGVIVGQGSWQAQLDANKHAQAVAFVTRPAFQARYPSLMSATAFVDTLNVNTGGVLTPFERASLISELSANPTDSGLRGDVLMKVAENPLLTQREFNRAFVLMQYFGYLRRNPDAAPEPGLSFDGFNFWLAKLNSFNGNFLDAEMVKAFINSSEYRGRFGP